MTERNSLVDVLHASESVAGVDTDASGDTVVTVSRLRHIEDEADVQASASGGYVAHVRSVSENDVTVRVYESAGSNAPLSPVTGGSGVADLTLHATGQ